MKVAWEILKALGLRERGPVLIACPTCGRLQFDMDTVVAEIESRLEQYAEPIEVAVLGCAVNGIGEASHADFGITGAKNEGLIFAHGKPLRKVPQARAGRRAVRGDRQVARPRRRRRRRPQGCRGRRVAAEDRGRERRRADARAHRPDGGGGRAAQEGQDVTAEPFLKRGQASRRPWTRTPRRSPAAASPGRHSRRSGQSARRAALRPAPPADRRRRAGRDSARARGERG